MSDDHDDGDDDDDRERPGQFRTRILPRMATNSDNSPYYGDRDFWKKGPASAQKEARGRVAIPIGSL